jgi:phage terminase large subunit-like protein
MNPIEQYHADQLDHPERYCKKIHKLRGLVENLISSGVATYDNRRAHIAIAFIESFCKHSKAPFAGHPVVLESWQRYVIAVVFGMLKSGTRFRYFREVFLTVARKNGKSTLLSAIALYMLMMDGESGAEVYSIATKKDQARITFNESLRMVKASPELNGLLKTPKTVETHSASMILFERKNAKFEPLASDSNSLDGLNPHLTIIDEVHALKDRNLYDVMLSAMGSRTQPLLWCITTMGFVRESIFDSLYGQSEGILDGKSPCNGFLPIVYELDDISEWTDPDKYIKANPNIGVSKSMDEMRRQFAAAQSAPEQKNGYLAKHCNIRASGKSSYIDYIDIEKCGAEIDTDVLMDGYAVGGVDLSNTTDLTCATALIPISPDRLIVLQRYFMAEAQARIREQEDRIPYSEFRDLGILELTPGHAVSYAAITEWYEGLRKEYRLTFQFIGYDPWNSKYWVDDMEAHGYQMHKVRQGAQTLSVPMKEMRAEFQSGHIVYEKRNGLLRWNMDNCDVETDKNENIRPVKVKSRARIDGAVSLIVAYTTFTENRQTFEDVWSIHGR